MTTAPVLFLSDDRTVLGLDWPDGRRGRFHAAWLRDHGQDPATRDPRSGQKLLTATDIDPAIRIRTAVIADGRIDLAFDGGVSTWIDSAWLWEMAPDPLAEDVAPPSGRITWDAGLDAASVSAAYPTLREDPAALAGWLGWIDTLGFARLTDVPAKPGALFEVIALFGFVRETNYGRLFEVRSRVEAENLAYTRLGLDPHTDNPYRDPVPTLQILHCLENTATGGDSSVVDGFRAAEILKSEYPDHFDLLARYPVEFRYRGDGRTDLVAERPMLELAPGGGLQQVRINNRAFHALRSVPFDLVPGFYAAYRHLVEITRRPSVVVSFRLDAGDLFVVDNTRVLHGRTAFDAAGSRWLQGAYADIDGLRSTLRALRAPAAA